MATALKTPTSGMTGAVRSLQWTIQDLNGSVEHLGQSHDHLRRAQNIMAWTTAIFGALLLSGLVWIANDIFHLKDQLMDTDRRFDGIEAQMSALGTRIEDLNITIEQVGAELLAARTPGAPATGPDVSVLSTPTTTANVQAAANAPLETTVPDAAVQPADAQAQPQQAALAPAPDAAAPPALPSVAPSPPAPRDQLTPEELAAPAPVVVAAAPAAAPAPAAEAPAPATAEATSSGEQAAPAEDAAAPTVVAAAPAAEPAPAAAAPAAPAADLSDDQLLSFNDDQIDPADELLLLDENGNPQ